MLVCIPYPNFVSQIRCPSDIVVWDSHPLALGATPLVSECIIHVFTFSPTLFSLASVHRWYSTIGESSWIGQIRAVPVLPQGSQLRQGGQRSREVRRPSALKPTNSSKDAIFINVKSLSACHHNSGEAVSRKTADRGRVSLLFGTARSPVPVPMLNAGL